MYFAGCNLVTSVALIYPLYTILFSFPLFSTLDRSISNAKNAGESKQSLADNVCAVRLTMRIVFALFVSLAFPVLLFYLSTYRRTRVRVHTPPHTVTLFLFVSF